MFVWIISCVGIADGWMLMGDYMETDYLIHAWCFMIMIEFRHPYGTGWWF